MLYCSVKLSEAAVLVQILASTLKVENATMGLPNVIGCKWTQMFKIVQNLASFFRVVERKTPQYNMAFMLLFETWKLFIVLYNPYVDNSNLNFT